MSVESDIDQAAGLSEPAEAATAANPALLGLTTFLPAGITLGLWFIGYLPLDVPGGMIPIITGSAGLFLLVATVWAARLGASAVAAILGLFSAFWLSFAVLLVGATSGWWGYTAQSVTSVQAAYLLSFLLVFILLTVITLRLPMTFTAGFVFVDITFALALAGVLGGPPILFTLAGCTTFIFCAIYAYILADGMSQELGGRAYPLGNPIVK